MITEGKYYRSGKSQTTYMRFACMFCMVRDFLAPNSTPSSQRIIRFRSHRTRRDSSTSSTTALRAPTTVDNDTIPRTRTYDDPPFGTKRAHTP